MRGPHGCGMTTCSNGLRPLLPQPEPGGRRDAVRVAHEDVRRRPDGDRHAPLDVSEQADPIARRVSQLARFQARDGARVTSLRHQAVDLDDEAARRLLILLDGTRDTGALIDQSGLDAATVKEYLRKLSSLSLLVA